MRRPVFAFVLILLLVVVGGSGFFELGADRFPQVDLPIVSVSASLPGAAPENVETEITDRIEEAVNTLASVEELRSIVLNFQCITYLPVIPEVVVGNLTQVVMLFTGFPTTTSGMTSVKQDVNLQALQTIICSILPNKACAALLI